jgi:hypothetical protein
MANQEEKRGLGESLDEDRWDEGMCAVFRRSPCGASQGSTHLSLEKRVSFLEDDLAERLLARLTLLGSFRVRMGRMRIA